MKSKLVILSLLLTGAAVTATAQTKEKYYSESCKDNFFISIAGGVQASMNPDNFDYGIGKAITPKVALSLGKWINPVWGVRGQVNGWQSKLNTEYGHKGITNKVKKNYITLHADAIYNLSNAIGGYNPERLFTVSAFAGPGFTFAKAYGNQKDVNALINGSVGLMGQFNISKYFDINIEARGEVSPSMFGHYSSAHTDGAVSVLAGLTYTFGGKKFAPVGGKIDQDAINAEINKYRKALAEAEDELARTKNALANAKGQVKEVTKEIQVVGPRAIFFMIGKTNIDDYGMVNIKLAAKTIKANPDKKYKVAGYADKATGSSSWNQKLSEKRAQNVYDALIKEGVSASQLEYVGFGGTENMFDKNLLNRVVILE